MVAAATSAAGTDGADITDAVFRASPAYCLIPYERLSAAERHSVSQLSADPTFYGLFLPRGGTDDASATIKTADTDTALLAYTLHQPAPLPSYVRLQLGPRLNATVLRLVLDGVLEMKWGDAFVSGSRAHHVLFPEVAPYRGQGRLGALSFAALRYAELLHGVPANRISDRLYFFNRWPISAEWKTRLVDDAASRAYIGLDRAPTARSLDRHWRARTDSDRDAAWFYWSSRAATDAPNSPAASGMWKAYVSPAPEAIAEVFAALVDTLGNNSAAFGLKIGKGSIGLMRPDKIVIYFPTHAALEDAMGRLLHRVAGTPAQGVPFSAPLDDDGLVSFGFDPSRADGRARLQAPSWRRWITDRLGASLAEARPAPAATPAWRRALDRLQLDGIDVDRWMPTANFGSECP